jgi:hypothetical protein
MATPSVCVCGERRPFISRVFLHFSRKFIGRHACKRFEICWEYNSGGGGGWAAVLDFVGSRCQIYRYDLNNFENHKKRIGSNIFPSLGGYLRQTLAKARSVP